MEDVLLSICISSYNRGKKCAGLVRNILAVEDDRYNIFICDDCSDRENLDELWSLRNPKVTLVKNAENAGACPNWYRTVCCGNGHYILHVLDRDDIVTGYLPRLLDLLGHVSVAGGYVGMSAVTLLHKTGRNADCEILKKGEEAFVTMAGVPLHPTGFLVNREYWQKGNFRKFFYHQEKYGIYPHSYVLGKLALQADLLHMPVKFWTGSYRGCNRFSRFYEKSERKDYWWLPENMIREADRLMLYLYPLAGDTYKERFLCRRLREAVHRSTLEYREIAAEKSEMGRYGLETRWVSKGSMLLILVRYWFIFLHILKKLDGEKRCGRRSLALIWGQGVRDILEAG